MSYPFFKYPDNITNALFRSRRAKQAAAREFKEGPIEVLPGIFSTDPQFIKFKDILSVELTKMFPENVDEWGRVYGNGVRSNFYSMRHINGYPMIPATWPLASNIEKRKKANLTAGFTQQWHKWLFEAFVRLAFTGLEPQAHKMRKGSSSCIPDFTTIAHEKEEMARQAYKDAEAAGKLMLVGNYKDAYLYYEMGGAYYVVYRAQSTDGVTFEERVWKSKDRKVADLNFAISGGEQGSEFIADKTAMIENEPLPTGFFRERRRTAQGIPGPLGAALTPMAQSVRKNIYQKYGFSFHHTTRTQMEDKVHAWDFSIATDVSDHDAFYPTQVIELWVDTLREMGFAEWWVALFEASFHLPIYVSAPGPDLGQTLIGDWRKPDLKMGLSSGNPFTDLMGTGMMSVVYAIMQIEHTAPHYIKQITSLDNAVRFLDSYLKGQLEIGQMSKSDDAFLLFKKGPVSAAAHTLQRKLVDDEQVSDYMLIGYEHGGAFLGSILLYDSSKKLESSVFIGNILSLLRNHFSPEYGVESHKRDRSKVKRPYPGLAWASMKQVYGDCPIYTEVLDLINSVWRRVFGYSYNLYREKLLIQDSRALHKATKGGGLSMGQSDYSPVEIDVLNDPSRLQWRYNEGDVRQQITDHLFHGVHLEDVSPYFKSIVNNVN